MEKAGTPSWAERDEQFERGYLWCFACECYHPIKAFHKRPADKRYGYAFRCRESDSLRKARYRKRYPVAALASVRIATAQNRANKKNLPFDLTTEWFIAELEKLNYIDPWSKKAFVIGDGNSHHILGVSIDRISNDGGYTQDNCQLVAWGFNQLKGVMTTADAIEYIQAVASNTDITGVPHYAA